MYSETEIEKMKKKKRVNKLLRIASNYSTKNYFHDSYIRSLAIKKLEEIALPKVVKPLCKLLLKNGTYTDNRKQIIISLGGIGYPGAKPTLQLLLKKEHAYKNEIEKALSAIEIKTFHRERCKKQQSFWLRLKLFSNNSVKQSVNIENIIPQMDLNGLIRILLHRIEDQNESDIDEVLNLMVSFGDKYDCYEDIFTELFNKIERKEFVDFIIYKLKKLLSNPITFVERNKNYYGKDKVYINALVKLSGELGEEIFIDDIFSLWILEQKLENFYDAYGNTNCMIEAFEKIGKNKVISFLVKKMKELRADDKILADKVIPLLEKFSWKPSNDKVEENYYINYLTNQLLSCISSIYYHIDRYSPGQVDYQVVLITQLDNYESEKIIEPLVQYLVHISNCLYESKGYSYKTERKGNGETYYRIDNDSLRDDHFVREKAALQALKNYGRLAMPYLIKYLNSVEKDHERSEIIKALESIGWQPSDELENVFYSIYKRNEHELEKNKKLAIKPLLKIIDSEYRDPSLQTWAAYTLGKIGDQNIAAELKQYCNTDDIDLKDTINKTLNKLYDE